MNCDDVFDLLTAATDDHASRHESVDSHLSRCSACRELATALQPAVALLRESAVAGDHHATPAVSSAPWLIAPEAQPRSWTTLARPQARRRLALWPLAAAVLAGLAVGGLAQRWLDQPWPSGAAPSLAEQADGAWELTFASDGSDGSDGFDSRIRLASACVQNEGASPPAGKGLSLADLACCTNCHHAQAGPMAALAVADLAASCRLCHSP